MKQEQIYKDVLNFWFRELEPKDWFEKNDEKIAAIRERFTQLHEEAAHGGKDAWREAPESALALVIVLDQFSRELYKDSAEGFACDNYALEVVEDAIARGFDMEVPEEMRVFFYMPFMHSESPEVHARAVEHFNSLENKEYLHYEKLHKRIIDRFGRYPHRNKMLGRTTTPEEQEFLENDKNASF